MTKLATPRRKVGDTVENADRTLLELRSRRAVDVRPLDLEHLTNLPGTVDLSGDATNALSRGIALIAPDGHVVTATPHASTAGWPRLMTRLATSGDVLAIGEPIPAKNGQPGFVPMGRQIIAPDGSFGGILMYSLSSDDLARLSPPLRSFDGCMTLVTDDDTILARTPGGTRHGRHPHDANATGGRDPRERRKAAGRDISPIDGVDRIFAYRHLPALPLTVVVGIGYDAIFADTDTLRLTVIGTQIVSTVLILMAAFFWYTRRRRARVSADAFTAILGSIEHGIRVENRDGRVVAANAAGAALRLPEDAGPRTEAAPARRRHHPGRSSHLADGGTVVIGTDVTARHAAEARIDVPDQPRPPDRSAQSLAARRRASRN